jgi:hypothetical protein
MAKSAGPSGLKIDLDDRDHALTGVAIACRPFGPKLLRDNRKSSRQQLLQSFLQFVADSRRARLKLRSGKAASTLLIRQMPC